MKKVLSVYSRWDYPPWATVNVEVIRQMTKQERKEFIDLLDILKKEFQDEI